MSECSFILFIWRYKCFINLLVLCCKLNLIFLNFAYRNGIRHVSYFMWVTNFFFFSPNFNLVHKCPIIQICKRWHNFHCLSCSLQQYYSSTRWLLKWCNKTHSSLVWLTVIMLNVFFCVFVSVFSLLNSRYILSILFIQNGRWHMCDWIGGLNTTSII